MALSLTSWWRNWGCWNSLPRIGWHKLANSFGEFRALLSLLRERRKRLKVWSTSPNCHLWLDYTRAISFRGLLAHRTADWGALTTDTYCLTVLQAASAAPRSPPVVSSEGSEGRLCYGPPAMVCGWSSSGSCSVLPGRVSAS